MVAWSNTMADICVYFNNHFGIDCTLTHRLHTLTALQGTATQVSVFGLSNNNKWQLWVWMTAQVGWLTMEVNSHLVFSLQS